MACRQLLKQVCVCHRLAEEFESEGKTSIQDYVDSRPPMVEVEAVRRALYLARQAGCKLHFVHLSTGEAVREVVKARNEGQDVTCETCVHYLTLTVDDFKKIGPEAKCSPALRTKDVLDDLWKMVESGAVSAVTSDHSPAPLSMKQDPDNNIFNIWGGITGAQNNVDLFYQLNYLDLRTKDKFQSGMMLTLPSLIRTNPTLKSLKISTIRIHTALILAVKSMPVSLKPSYVVKLFIR